MGWEDVFKWAAQHGGIDAVAILAFGYLFGRFMYGPRVKSTEAAVGQWEKAYNAAEVRRRDQEEAGALREAEAQRAIGALQEQAQASLAQATRTLASLAVEDRARSLYAISRLVDLVFLSWWLGIARLIGIERMIAREGKAGEFVADVNALQDELADLSTAYFHGIASAAAFPWQLPDETAFETAVRNLQARYGTYVTRKVGEGEETRFEMPTGLIRLEAPATATAAVLPPNVSVKG